MSTELVNIPVKESIHMGFHYNALQVCYVWYDAHNQSVIFHKFPPKISNKSATSELSMWNLRPTNVSTLPQIYPMPNRVILNYVVLWVLYSRNRPHHPGYLKGHAFMIHVRLIKIYSSSLICIFDDQTQHKSCYNLKEIYQYRDRFYFLQNRISFHSVNIAKRNQKCAIVLYVYICIAAPSLHYPH